MENSRKDTMLESLHEGKGSKEHHVYTVEEAGECKPHIRDHIVRLATEQTEQGEKKAWNPTVPAAVKSNKTKTIHCVHFVFVGLMAVAFVSCIAIYLNYTKVSISRNYPKELTGPKFTVNCSSTRSTTKLKRKGFMETLQEFSFERMMADIEEEIQTKKPAGVSIEQSKQPGKNAIPLRAHLRMHQAIIDMLVPWVAKEPVVEPAPACIQAREQAKRRQHRIPTQKECAKFSTAFSGKLLPGVSNGNKEGRKIGFVTLIGFEGDVLEVHLAEIYEAVDYIFLMESTAIHGPSPLRKPLVWETLRTQKRFQRFQPKIVYLVSDDSEIPEGNLAVGGIGNVNNTDRTIFALEGYQKIRRYEKLMAWNKETKVFGPDDWIGFGDADGVLKGENLPLLRYCEAKHWVMDVGIWFSFGDISTAFRPDYPVDKVHHPYSLGMASFYQVGKLKEDFLFQIPAIRQTKMAIPNNLVGLAGRYMLGGMHMTHYPYLPFLLMKTFTASEYYRSDQSEFLDMAKKLHDFVKDGDLLKFQEYMVKKVFALGKPLVQALGPHRFKPAKQLEIEDPELYYLPWFLECNIGGRYYIDIAKEIDPRLTANSGV
eukprot:Nk52_evm5s1636 gene=Nk52_evmTU5s1636